MKPAPKMTMPARIMPCGPELTMIQLITGPNSAVSIGRSAGHLYAVLPSRAVGEHRLRRQVVQQRACRNWMRAGSDHPPAKRSSWQVQDFGVLSLPERSGSSWARS
jgi:hypothetical protein